MVRAHHPAGIPAHLVSPAHGVGHLHLALVRRGLLVEVFHLAVVRGVVVLAVVVMRRGVVSIGLPVEPVVGVVLVAQRRVAGGCYRGRWGGDDAAGVAAQRRQVSVHAVRRDLERLLLDRRRHGRGRRGDAHRCIVAGHARGN